MGTITGHTIAFLVLQALCLFDDIITVRILSQRITGMPPVFQNDETVVVSVRILSICFRAAGPVRVLSLNALRVTSKALHPQH
jgi:hypothetical protein